MDDTLDEIQDEDEKEKTVQVVSVCGLHHIHKYYYNSLSFGQYIKGKSGENIGEGLTDGGHGLERCVPSFLRQSTLTKDSLWIYVSSGIKVSDYRDSIEAIKEELGRYRANQRCSN